MDKLRLVIDRIFRHTPEVWSFHMSPASGPRPEFIAGQVAVLEREGLGSFYAAFASAPEDEGFEFLIKRSSSSQAANSLFESGGAIETTLNKIAGHGFPTSELRGHDLVFVGMGTGMAPLRSALRHVLRSRADYGRLIVLYGVRKIEDFCYQNEMDHEWRRQGVEIRQVVSRPSQTEWSGPTGYVQSLLDNLYPDLPNPAALVCGSGEMIQQTTERLKQLGFEPGKILTNY